MNTEYTPAPLEIKNVFVELADLSDQDIALLYCFTIVLFDAEEHVFKNFRTIDDGFHESKIGVDNNCQLSINDPAAFLPIEFHITYNEKEALDDYAAIQKENPDSMMKDVETFMFNSMADEIVQQMDKQLSYQVVPEGFRERLVAKLVKFSNEHAMFSPVRTYQEIIFPIRMYYGLKDKVTNQRKLN